MNEEAFADLVEEQVGLLPPALLGRIQDCTIYAEAVPTDEQKMAAVGTTQCRLRGLYSRPSKAIVIFRQGFDELGGDPAGLRQAIQDTLKHEIGHHLGMTESEVRGLGL